MNKLLTSAFLASSLLVSSCGDDSNSSGAHSQSHDYDPMHGGDVVHLGEHKPMIEVRHDESAGEIQLWAFDVHHKVLELPSAPKLMIGTDKTITGEGSKSHWVFRDEVLQEHLHDLEFAIEVWERGEKKVYRQDWHAAH